MPRVVLRAGVALLGRTARPADGFHVVLRHPETARVQEAEGSLTGGMALFGRSPEPTTRQRRVLLHPATVLVPLAELRLRRSVSRLGQFA